MMKIGSIWNKWDMHIHTPYTKSNNQYKTPSGEDIWSLFCEKINESDVSVFGITDYFSVKNYFIFKEKYFEKYPHSEKVFFPNIEFRMDSKNTKSDHIQYHVIFNNSEKTLNKLEQFLVRLKLISTDDKDLTSKYCTELDLQEVTYAKAMVKVDDLEKALSENFTKLEYLTVGVANGYGSLRPNGGKDGRGG